jgi:hypothetical protein
MIRYAVAVGFCLGVGSAWMHSRLPTRPPVDPQFVRSHLASTFQSGTQQLGPKNILIPWQNGFVAVSPYANPIPLYMQGGQVIHINGTISKVGD